MAISGLSSSSSASLAYASARMHSPGCSCAQCAPQPVEMPSEPAQTSNADYTVSISSAGSSKSKAEMSEAELAALRKLQARDREVRQHEQAHMAAAGGLAVSGPHYTLQRGPDGVNYAIGGEVNIDVSPGNTPEETIEKAETIQRAALAPAEPSGADRAVAAKGQQMEQQARIELEQQESEQGEQAASTSQSEASAPERTEQAAVKQVQQQPEQSQPSLLQKAYDFEQALRPKLLNAYA